MLPEISQLYISENNINDYFQLINEIEHITEKLSNIHSQHIKCCKTCSSCCEKFMVLPVEKYIIENQISKANFEIADSNSTSCKYLINNICSIYNFRPVMCRTHGFPLLYFNSDMQTYEFSSCDMNFIDFELENLTEDICILMDEINTRLYSLNQKFIEENKTMKAYSETLVDFG